MQTVSIWLADYGKAAKSKGQQQNTSKFESMRSTVVLIFVTANAAQGYRLGLFSTAHASPAGAAENEKHIFLDSTHDHWRRQGGAGGPAPPPMAVQKRIFC